MEFLIFNLTISPFSKANSFLVPKIVSHIFPGMIDLTLSPNNNYSQENDNGAGSAGATGFATSAVVTAEIEDGEEDAVQIDSPVGTQVNVMSLLCSSVPVPQVRVFLIDLVFL